MSDRTPIVGGNWKMNTTLAEARDLARAVAESGGGGCEVCVFPPFVYLPAAIEAAAGGTLAIGGQDLYTETSGAFTGEVSAAMLSDIGATDVLVGHSERRHVLGESDAFVGAKLRAAIDGGLRPTLCIGELLEEREAGETDAVNNRQLDAALEGIDGTAAARLIIAYEPVWAIGTGRTATPDDAQSAHAAIRQRLADRYGDQFAAAVRIQYGGSVKPGNAAELIAQPDVDGFLVGGASLKATDFLAIVDAVQAATVA